MTTKVKTVDQYFEAREKLDKEYWAEVDRLNDAWDKLMEKS